MSSVRVTCGSISDALWRTLDGQWFFLDWLGNIFWWKSKNISTAKVSEVLEHYPGVYEAIVYGVEVPKHEGRAGCAAVVLESTAPEMWDFADFHKYVSSRLLRYAVPVFLWLGESFLHTDNNKQNKVPLRNQRTDPANIDPGDIVLWCKPGAHRYVLFTLEDWNGISWMDKESSSRAMWPVILSKTACLVSKIAR